MGQVAFSPDGKQLAAAFGHYSSKPKPGGVRVWDLNNGKELRTLRGHPNRVRFVAYTADGHTIVSAGDDNNIKLWDSRTGAEVDTFRQHRHLHVRSMALSRDGRRLVSASQYRTAVWDVQFATQFKKPGKPDVLDTLTETITSTAVSPDGRLVAAAEPNGKITVWGKTTRAVCKLSGGYNLRTVALAFSMDSSRLAAVSAARNVQIRIWHAETGTPVHTLKRTGSGVAFSPNARRIVVAGGKGATILNVNTGKSLLNIASPNDTEFSCAAFSHDGRRLALAGKNIEVYSASSGRLLQTMHGGHPIAVTAVAFSADGQRLTSIGPRNNVKIWNVSNGDELLTLPPGAGVVKRRTFTVKGKPAELSANDNAAMASMSFNADGTQLAVSTTVRNPAGDVYGEYKVWDATPLPDSHWSYPYKHPNANRIFPTEMAMWALFVGFGLFVSGLALHRFAGNHDGLRRISAWSALAGMSVSFVVFLAFVVITETRESTVVFGAIVGVIVCLLLRRRARASSDQGEDRPPRKEDTTE